MPSIVTVLLHNEDTWQLLSLYIMASSCGVQDTSCNLDCHHVTIGLTMMKTQNGFKSDGGFDNNIA
jgi:hypothetical protein